MLLIVRVFLLSVVFDVDHLYFGGSYSSKKLLLMPVELRSHIHNEHAGIKAQVATAEQASVKEGQQVEAPVAIVTGASRGIGRAIALSLGKAGCKVHLFSVCVAYVWFNMLHKIRLEI